MPANLPPTYYKLKHQHEAARTDQERLPILEEMLRIVPKHKGTEKVVSDLRHRIAKIKREPAAGSKGQVREVIANISRSKAQDRSFYLDLRMVVNRRY